MIQSIKFTKNNIEYNYTYSDKFVYIKREEIEYIDAIDPANTNRIYFETENPLPLEVIANIQDQIKAISNEE